jgi:hypothetical protein
MQDKNNAAQIVSIYTQSRQLHTLPPTAQICQSDMSLNLAHTGVYSTQLHCVGDSALGTTHTANQSRCVARGPLIPQASSGLLTDSHLRVRGLEYPQKHARPTHLTEPGPGDASNCSVGLSGQANQTHSMRAAAPNQGLLVSPAKVEQDNCFVCFYAHSPCTRYASLDGLRHRTKAQIDGTSVERPPMLLSCRMIARDQRELLFGNANACPHEPSRRASEPPRPRALIEGSHMRRIASRLPLIFGGDRCSAL